MADTFTNDLRIREQEVGANSGSWGGYLNTSLENIAEAFSYGTEALADSAAQTLTLADGASDELRSFYVKLTGTLSQATTVTLAPNTISKCWIIENATSGGYDVTISQGSGANVTVGNGNVKMIATDGAGAGGVVHDLLTDLELAGNVSITTTDNSDNLTLTSTDADANAGPNLRLYRNSGTPADSDALGLIEFEGRNDNTQDVVYAGIDSRIVDASDGTEDGRLEIVTMLAGTAGTSRILMDATETVFNDNSADLDFRVESDANANRLFVDAGQDQVLLGTTAARNLSGIYSSLSQEGTNYNTASLSLIANSNDTAGAYILIGSSRGTSNGSSTALNNGDQIGGLYFNAADGTDMNHAAARIDAIVYGDVSENDVPGALRFFTTPDGSATATEKMRILPSGGITFNGDTSTANALDDYEEGTWTPAISSGTATFSEARYTKIGRLVHFSYQVQGMSDITSANHILVTGLPFPVAASQAAGSAFGTYTDNYSANVVYATTSEIVYLYAMSTGTWDTMLHSELNSTSNYFYVSGTYQAE